jgi:alkanesulfonate monooxygenase SsuD/methylene tetrahydromethanopterin reductase-like flavin-dependent oxidoreductase (luciferase family)
MNKILADLLTRQRAALKAEATALAIAADKDNGSVLTKEQETRFNTIEGDVATIDAELAAATAVAETPEAVADRVRAETADIIAACALAGQPAKAADFIKAKTSLADAVKALQAEKVKASGAELNARNSGPLPGPGDTDAPKAWDKAVARVNSRVKAA